MLYIYKWEWKNDRMTAYGVDDVPGPIRTLNSPLHDFILLEGQGNDPVALPGLTKLTTEFIDEYTGKRYTDGLYQLETGPHLSLGTLREVGAHPEQWRFAASFLNDIDASHRHFMLKQYPYYVGWFDELPSGEIRAVPDRTEVPTFTVLFYDLECVAGQPGRFPHELEAEDRVCSISYIKAAIQGDTYTLLDSTVLLVTSRPEDLSTDVYRVKTFPTERALLGYALRHHFSDPSVHFISGFNTSGFDDRFLAGRFYRYQLETHLTRYQYPFREEGLVSLWYTPHQLCLDLYKFYKEYTRYEQNSLDYLARRILGDAKIPMDHQDLRRILLSTETVPLPDLRHALDYNYHDSWITFQLFMKARLLDFTLTISATCFLNLERVILAGKSELLLGYLCVEGYRQGYLVNYAMKNRYRRELTTTTTTTYQGAYVYLQRPGVYSHIGILDFVSIYPSLMSSKNLSLSTCRESPTPPLTNEDREAYFSVEVAPRRHCWSLKRPRGLFPVICERLLALRKRVKCQLDDPSLPTHTRRYLTALQLAVKIINNSLYGQLGAPFSLFYLKIAAEGVTAHSRRIIRLTRDYLTSLSIPCVFIDTDSVFIKIAYEAHARALAIAINAHIGIPELSIAFECYYLTLFLYGKKKYYGLLQSGDYKASGFEVKRRDFPQHGKPILEQVLKLALHHRDEGDLISAFTGFRDQLFRVDLGHRYDLFSKTLELRPLYKYSPHCSAPHVKYLKRFKLKLSRGEFVSLRYSPIVQHHSDGNALSLVNAFSTKEVPVNLAQCVKGACHLFDKIYGILLKREKVSYFKECMETMVKYNLVVCELTCVFHSVQVTFEQAVTLNLPDFTEEINRKRKRKQPTLLSYFKRSNSATPKCIDQ